MTINKRKELFKLIKEKNLKSFSATVKFANGEISKLRKFYIEEHPFVNSNVLLFTTISKIGESIPVFLDQCVIIDYQV